MGFKDMQKWLDELVKLRLEYKRLDEYSRKKPGLTSEDVVGTIEDRDKIGEEIVKLWVWGYSGSE